MESGVNNGCIWHAVLSRHADIIVPNDNKHDVAVDFLIAKIKDILNNG